MKFSNIATLVIASLCVAALPLASAADNENLRGRRTKEGPDVQPFRATQTEEVPNDEYIVVFRGNPVDGRVSASAFTDITNSVIGRYEGTATMKTYSNIIHGATMKLSKEALADLQKHPDVESIEKNIEIHALQSMELQTQTQDLPWGLDRIDQPRGTDGSYTYQESGGENVHAYVIDTGIRSTHEDFWARLGNGYNARQWDVRSPRAWDDCNGHGTHVASTLGGTKYGVAKGVTLHAVRVLNCQGGGTLSDVIEGMDWVVQQHLNNPGQKTVVNMSIGGGYHTGLNSVARNMFNMGIFVVAAAGNSNGNACHVSPASATGVFTVAATDRSDKRAWYSNSGTCVDIFAPGNDILGANAYCDTCTFTISGTSMASPHVAGVAALLLASNDIGTSPTEIRNLLLALAANGIVSNENRSPNRLLQAP